MKRAASIVCIGFVWASAPAVSPAGEVASDHWAFRPIRRPEEPPVRNRTWVRNPIDAFVLARLEREGLGPSPEADRATLIRRLSLDLLGLPPSPEEVDEFLRDGRFEAYEALVDRLLSSPHHAERWARHWLDLARYADSNGYTIDGSRSIWKYRDWVIEALRRDMPFDRFAIAQIAGDLLPGATVEDRVATGFHRNTLRNEEGGTDPEQFRVEAVADRVSTTATVFLGLTIGCARCHDHKYDPISQREYFQLFALFNNADEPAMELPTSQEARELPLLETEVAAAEKLLADNEAAVARRQGIWEKDLEGRLEVEWTRLDPVWSDHADSGGAALRGTARAPLERVTAVRLEPPAKKGPSLRELRVLPQPEGAGPGAPAGPPLPFAAAGEGVFFLKDPVTLERAAGLSLIVSQPRPAVSPEVLRLSATGAPSEVASLPEEVRRILARPAPERAPQEQERLAAHYRSIDKDRIPLAERVADLKKRQAELKRSITTTLVIKERQEPRETRIHLRGDFLRPGDPVEGGVPAVLSPLRTSGRRADRLDLARWLVDPENPLTPRVTMNRLWQAYFGRGIVGTENDFGAQGDLPTHPDLLDWLSSEFLEKGFSLRAMHRLVATSATYLQSSRRRPELLEKDPHQKLLGRQPRLRLEAEVIRDTALASSGLLNREIGGPGVYPPQPKAIFRFTQTAKYWKESQGPDRFRRGMYTYFWRSSPYPFLMAFDAPDATLSCTRRERSNTPLQALILANDPAFFEMAQALAARVLREAGPTDRERIERAFRLCLARAPEEREERRLGDLLHRERERLRGAPAEPPAGTGGLAASEATVWTALARVLLNLDEFITRE